MTYVPQPLPSAPRCRDCAVAMEFGTCPDGVHGGYNLLKWVRGTPVESWLLGQFTRAQITSAIKVITYRCPKCFRLESFAPPAPNQP